MLTASHLSYRHGSGGSGIVDISLEVKPGELVAVLGMNGSGKTTLGRVLSGLLLMDEGQILLAGKPIASEQLPARLGYLFSPVVRQFIGGTVEEDILFGLESRGLNREEIAERLQHVISSFNLQSVRHRLLSQLSQGEQQRAALAAVLVLNPDYLILDEPTAALDLETAGWLYDYLDILRRQGKGIIILTNQLEEACRADRIYLLAEGAIRAEGNPGQLLNNPALAAYGFQQTFAWQVVQALKNRGVDLKPCPMDTGGVVEAIWRWKSGI